MEALRPELHLWINVIPNKVMHMCASLLTIVFIVSTRAEATCVRQFTTAHLKSALTARTAPSVPPWETKKTTDYVHVSLWKCCSSEGRIILLHEQFWKCSAWKTPIWTHQLFPYIDLPAIILCSSLQNNRARSEIAIMDKQCDNMRSVWSSGA